MLTSATIVFSALLFASSASAHCGREYTVKEGDICDGISAATNTSTYQLAVVNHGVINSECTNLEPGKKICLGWLGADCQTTTIVQKDDSCEKIQARSGVNSTILNLNNPQINDDCSNLYIGEVLCTDKTVNVPDAPNGVIPATTIPATATPANTNIAIATSSSRPAPSPPASQSSPTPTPTPTPTPSATDDEDDEDCDDEDDTPASSAPASTTPAPASTTPAPASLATSAAPAVTSSAPADNYDENDESTWPYCDEL